MRNGAHAASSELTVGRPSRASPRAAITQSVPDFTTKLREIREKDTKI